MCVFYQCAAGGGAVYKLSETPRGPGAGAHTWKKAQAPQACLGNILDGWGTFWTKIYAVLLHFTVCRKLRIFHKVFKVKMGTLSPKKELWLIDGPNIWDITIIPCILLKFEWNCITNPGLHICRNFWKCQFHAFWGTFWNPQSLPGERKGTFFMSVVQDNPKGQPTLKQWP